MKLYAQSKPIELLKPNDLKSEIKIEEPTPAIEKPVMDSGLIGIVLMIAIGLNVVLAAASKILDMIKDKTSTQVDNKIALVVSKIALILGKIVDYAGMNRSHK